MELGYLHWVVHALMLAAAAFFAFAIQRKLRRIAQQRDRYRQVFRYMPENAILADSAMNICEVNVAAEETVEATRGAQRLGGLSLGSILNRTDGLERIRAKGAAGVVRESIRLGDANFDLRARVAGDPDCLESVAVATFRVAESRSKQWAELLGVVEGMPVNVIFASRNGRITFANESARATLPRLLGSASEEIVGRPIERIFQRAIPLGKETATETIRLKGESLELVTVPLPDGRGRWAGSLVTWASGQQRRRSEAAVLHMLDELDSATTHLAGCALELIDTAEQTAARAGDMLERTREVTDNTNSVANATEQMSGTINELSQNTRELADGVERAVSAVDRSREIVDGLRSAGREISRVSETITDIADQTNLLALNATIEAAGAGSAGRGFAVVANEVKELARETVQATDLIDAQVHGIISRSEEVAGAVDQIADVIGGVSSLATTLASAVEEQSRTTSEIAQSVTMAADSAGEIGGEMTSLASAASGAADTARSIQASAEELNTLSLALDKAKDTSASA